MFVANENFPRPSTLILRENGFVIKSIQEDCPGINDAEVIEIALEQNLIILTFDSDYGELIFKHAKDNPPSVVYFKEKGNRPEFAASSLMTLLSNPNIELSGAFTVIEPNNIRQRFYKKSIE
jgi:predicted nuclease of predicted toxin-antitoxin system